MDQEAGFMVNFINSYFIALGVLIGGALIGGLGAYLAGEAPLTAITKLANRLKIWALVAAIGGTFDAVYSFERGILEGNTRDIFKQLLLIISAMGGAKRLAHYFMADSGASFFMRVPQHYKKPGWQRFRRNDVRSRNQLVLFPVYLRNIPRGAGQPHRKTKRACKRLEQSNFDLSGRPP